MNKWISNAYRRISVYEIIKKMEEPFSNRFPRAVPIRARPIIVQTREKSEYLNPLYLNS
jgi:hypothetical protein